MNKRIKKPIENAMQKMVQKELAKIAAQEMSNEDFFREMVDEIKNNLFENSSQKKELRDTISHSPNSKLRNLELINYEPKPSSIRTNIPSKPFLSDLPIKQANFMSEFGELFQKKAADNKKVALIDDDVVKKVIDYIKNNLSKLKIKEKNSSDMDVWEITHVLDLDYKLFSCTIELKKQGENGKKEIWIRKLVFEGKSFQDNELNFEHFDTLLALILAPAEKNTVDKKQDCNTDSEVQKKDECDCFNKQEDCSCAEEKRAAKPSIDEVDSIIVPKPKKKKKK